MTKPIVTIGACAALLGAGIAQAADPEGKCQAQRYKAAGAYALCQQQALGKWYASNLGDADVIKFQTAASKCRVKYTDTWAKLRATEALAGSSCTAERFVDNGNGTVTDNLTALVWEKKTNPDNSENLADPHDRDNFYSSCADADADLVCNTPGAADGTAFRDFLRVLNSGECFAGTCDWRLPTLDELQTILADPWTAAPASPPSGVPCTIPSCIDAIFGPTASAFLYWSATSYASPPDFVWGVAFFDGAVVYASRPTFALVRAVRGGL